LRIVLGEAALKLKKAARVLDLEWNTARPAAIGLGDAGGAFALVTSASARELL
jgi:hypothetical protein